MSPYVRWQLLRISLCNSTAAFIISTQQPQAPLFHGQVAVWTIFNTALQLAWTFVVTAMINVVWMQIQHELHDLQQLLFLPSFPSCCCGHFFLLRCIFPALFRSTVVCSTFLLKTVFLSLQPILFSQRWLIWGRQVMQAWQIYGGRYTCNRPSPPFYRIIHNPSICFLCLIWVTSLEFLPEL